MSFIKSPLNYIGGKYKLLDKLIPLFPKQIETFVDLFAGGGDVFINTQAKKFVVNDIMFPVIGIFKDLSLMNTESIFLGIEDLIKEYDLSKSNKEGYNSLRNDYNLDPSSIKLLCLIAFGFNHQIRFNSKHKFNNPFGKDRSSFNDKTKQNLMRFITNLKMKDIVFQSNDFRTFNFETLSEKDFVYCDPPYLITSGTYNDGKRGFTGWSSVEEEELYSRLDQINYSGIKFMLSNVLESKGKTNTTLKEWSSKYEVVQVKTSYSNSNYQRKGNHLTKEVIVKNYQ